MKSCLDGVLHGCSRIGSLTLREHGQTRSYINSMRTTVYMMVLKRYLSYNTVRLPTLFRGSHRRAVVVQQIEPFKTISNE